jgi:hypothetical protein
MAFSDYSTNPDNNTTIAGTNVAENCSPGGINNAIRQLMADGKALSGDIPDTSTLIPKTGGIFTGNPKYTGRGGYIYHNDPNNTSGKLVLVEAGAPTPTGLANGDFVGELE